MIEMYAKHAIHNPHLKLLREQRDGQVKAKREMLFQSGKCCTENDWQKCPLQSMATAQERHYCAGTV